MTVMNAKDLAHHNLLSTNPSLAKEWHPTKNGSLLPSDVMPKTRRKVWWLCAKGHEWEAYVYNRNGSKSIGCPFCAGQKASPEHCLATKYPLLAKEWHPTKNGGLLPRDVTPKSGQRVWWLCNKGHEWVAIISNRSRLGRGCPYCAGRYLTSENNLAVNDPFIAKQWHPTKNGSLLPKDVTLSSTNKVWWLCNQGHEWEDSVRHRRNNKSCPYCCGKRISSDNCLAAKNPLLAKEWHPTKNGVLLPSDVTPFSSKKVWWLCKKGHEWLTSLGNRSGGRGCPFCGNKKVSADNCLAVKNPQLAKQWHPTKNGELTPYHVLSSTSKKVWWLCNQGHEWIASINNRSKGRECPFCHTQISRFELRLYCELKSIFHDTKSREKIFGFEIDVFIPSINVGVEIDGLHWHRDRLNTDQQKLSNLEQNGIKIIRVREKGLPKLINSEVVFHRRDKDLEIIHKVLLKILEVRQSQDTSNYLIENYLRQNLIMNNEEYIELLNTLPAPFKGNTLEELNPLLAKQWHPTKNGSLQPKHVSLGSEKKVWWLCDKGHEWQAVVYSRNKGKGCPRCSYEKRGLNRTSRAISRSGNLPFAYPALSKQWNYSKNGDIKPEDVSPGSHRKVWWICNRGHEWEASIGSRSRGSGCPYCALRAVCADNCLQKVNPSLATEWHPTKNGNLTPSDVAPTSKKKVWWICNRGHEWEASIGNRNRGNKCPYCRQKVEATSKSVIRG